MFFWFSDYATPKLISLADIYIDKYLEYLASDYSRVIMSTNDLNILTVKENSLGEITTIEYDMNEVYKIASDLTNYLADNLDDVSKRNEYLDIVSDNDDGIMIHFPLGQLTNSVFLQNFGPSIGVNIRFVNSVFTNVKTKVTDYGINNALISVVLEVSLSYQIITPLKYEERTLNYELLLDTSVISGDIPSIYNGSLESKSSFLDISFKSEL